jgi:hypothetical protein
VFIIVEELQEHAVWGKPPKTKQGLCEFLEKGRKNFIKCYHVIAVNPIAQVYLLRDLHLSVHGGLLRPAIKPFLKGITNDGCKHRYYDSRVRMYSTPFLIIRNGKGATSLPSFNNLLFSLALSKVNERVVGSHWNSQCSWGYASLDIRQRNPEDLVTMPSFKKTNVEDKILPQFVVLSKLLLEVDSERRFYCGRVAGDSRRRTYAQPIMEEDPELTMRQREENVLECVSAISNLYMKDKKTKEMFAAADNAELTVHRCHSTVSTTCSTEDNKKIAMKTKFAAWDIPSDYVIVFPHVDRSKFCWNCF